MGSFHRSAASFQWGHEHGKQIAITTRNLFPCNAMGSGRSFDCSGCARGSFLADGGIGLSGGIFISYRRDDSPGFPGRIYDRLTNRLEREQIFFDNIEPGLEGHSA